MGRVAGEQGPPVGTGLKEGMASWVGLGRAVREKEREREREVGWLRLGPLGVKVKL